MEGTKNTTGGTGDFNNAARLIRAIVVALPDGKYRIDGEYDDGFKVVLRAKATRPYAFVALHAVPVTSKFFGKVEADGREDRRAFVTMGSTARASITNYGDRILQTIATEVR